MATKLVLPIVPLAKVKVRTLGGSRPACTDTAASAGSNESVMSISPSLSNWRCAGPLAGNCSPRRQRVGRSGSYQAHKGAVTCAKLASVAGRCSTAGSATRSSSACLRKVEPRKLLTSGWVSRPGCLRAQSSSAAADRGTSAALRMRAES